MNINSVPVDSMVMIPAHQTPSVGALLPVVFMSAAVARKTQLSISLLMIILKAGEARM